MPTRACPVPGCPALLSEGETCCAVHRARRRPCLTPRCPGFAAFRGRCEPCAEALRLEADAARPSAGARGYGGAWPRIRARVLREEPLCRLCGKPSAEVDHVVPRRAGGSDDRANLRALCRACHSRRSLGQAGARR